jgi:hypothetical protein
MTRQIFFQLLLILSFATYQKAAIAAGSKVDNRNAGNMIVNVPEAEIPLRVPVMPVGAGLKPPTHKMHSPAMEELPKIHRFHRERVKKVNKHQKKVWLSVKVLLIICHAALLICAFLHATH